MEDRTKKSITQQDYPNTLLCSQTKLQKGNKSLSTEETPFNIRYQNTNTEPNNPRIT